MNVLILIALAFTGYMLFAKATPEETVERKESTYHLIPSMNRVQEAPKDQLRPWGEDDRIGDITQPRPLKENAKYPVEYLSETAQSDFDNLLSRQSKTLDEAVNEYRKRYGIPPPPNFDKWFEFAQKNKVQLIDEFDTITDLMIPFWGIKPATIRSRARESLGFPNGLIGVAIRDQDISFLENSGGYEWQLKATVEMMEPFLKYLPDMDLAFNVHDEPRVILQHDDLSRLVKKAKEVTMPAAGANKAPINDFVQSVDGLSKKLRFADVKHSRFRSTAHQETWTTSRLSCSPDSAARMLDDDEIGDDIGKYSVTGAEFVFNTTAMEDICLSPSLSKSYGFFDRPNSYFATHDLFPVFSQSKIASYSDIIYPSPWYWADKVIFNATMDVQWEKKQSSLYWRGSTTGGFSRHGGWRRQHRQHLVQKINDRKQAKILTNTGGESKPAWSVSDAARGQYRDLIDVHFSHVGQCDPGDCAAQKQFFHVGKVVDMQEAWGYKHLLDMDGNAFSGRFYALLQSSSQVFKQALFQEWHREWIKPWVHFVPMSMRGEDWLELVRYYTGASSRAEKMAKESTAWSGKALRKVDMEAWFFRLLLEYVYLFIVYDIIVANDGLRYARVIDDNREVIGFDPSSADKRLPHKPELV